MDALNSDLDHLFSLPVALIFQNESSIEEQNDFKYNTTTTAPVNLSQSSHSWKKEEVVLNGLQRLEKVGDAIRRELKWALILHAYGFGCIFFILAFYTFFSILNIRSFISNRPFMSTINGFLCLLGTTRGLSLLINPYNLKENMPKLFGQVLWDLGFPSIISAFCLVQLAFHQFTQLNVGPESLRRKSCLSLIVTAHFLLTIGVDIVVASHENLTIVKHAVHYIFLTWGVYLCSNFLYTGYKVMSMLRKIPGRLKHNEVSDPSYKGIMQLAILAPHNNLEGSLTTALLPALCTPKIHQQDSINLSAVAFRNDGNPRILESESIPMLEEITGSSGDEISPKPLARGSSFQNQTRNFQKFNLRPKLSLRNISHESKEDESAQMKYSESKLSTTAKSKNQFPKTLLVKANEFDFSIKPTNGILKNTESFAATKNLLEFKNKAQQKTCFENENFPFSVKNKSKVNNLSGSKPEADNLVPEILVSEFHNPENDEKGKEKGSNLVRNDKNKKTLRKLMNEISKDLNEMQILREEEIKSEEIVEVYESKRNECESELENDIQNKVEVDRKCRDSRRRNQFFEEEHEKISCGNECEGFTSETTTATTKEAVTLCSAFTEITKYEEPKINQQKVKGRIKGKSLSWKKKTENEKNEKATTECLLLQGSSEDVTLRSVLDHIASINRGTSNKTKSEDDFEKVRKSKIEWVLNITYITAMWGLMLCLSNMGKIYSLFGVPESRKDITFLNSTYLQGKTPTETNKSGILYSSWPWLWFQTFCRALELAMGCAMANITRQPAANHRSQPRTKPDRYATARDIGHAEKPSQAEI